MSGYSGLGTSGAGPGGDTIVWTFGVEPGAAELVVRYVNGNTGEAFLGL